MDPTSIETETNEVMDVDQVMSHIEGSGENKDFEPREKNEESGTNILENDLERQVYASGLEAAQEIRATGGQEFDQAADADAELDAEDAEGHDEQDEDEQPLTVTISEVKSHSEGQDINDHEDTEEPEVNFEDKNEEGFPRVDLKSSGSRNRPSSEATTKSRDRPLTRAASVLPELTPRMAELGRIPSHITAERSEQEKRVKLKEATRPRLPNKLVRLATVKMTSTARQSTAIRDHATYIDQQRTRQQKMISWDEATNNRPPLRIDMDTPGPTRYSPRNKPLREDNAPSWSFGRRTFVEKEGGSRTSWEKTWFQSPNIWQQKTDFYNDKRWPAPTYYQLRPTVGKQVTADMPTHPAFSFGIKRSTQLGKKGTETEPSPTDYDIEKSFIALSAKAPSFSHGLRRGGTNIWSNHEYAPGPGSYNPDYHPIQIHRPAFSIQGGRREKSHVFGPFATL